MNCVKIKRLNGCMRASQIQINSMLRFNCRGMINIIIYLLQTFEQISTYFTGNEAK